MNLFTKQKQTHRHRNKFMATKRERGAEVQIRSLELIETTIYETDKQ